jgi:hypothetical protein
VEDERRAVTPPARERLDEADGDVVIARLVLGLHPATDPRKRVVEVRQAVETFVPAGPGEPAARAGELPAEPAPEASASP